MKNRYMNLNLRNYIGAASLLLLLVACGNKGQQGMPAPPPVNVTVQQVGTSSAPYYDEYPAIVKALNEVELRPQVNGYITGIHFTEGQQVKKGDKLYSIDQQQYEANYQQAQANVQVYEANLVKAKKDVDRYRQLDKADAIAKQQVDNAEAVYASAVQQLEAAKATVRGVQTSVRYTNIAAPFDGTIGLSQVRLGAAVSAGQTILNTISSDDPIAVDITVDQREIMRFNKLLSAGSKPNDSTFTLSFGGQVYQYPGKISVIDRGVDPQTGTIKLRLTFPNPEHTLRSGMSTKLRVLASTSDKAMIIPYKAVVEQLGEFFVYSLGDSNKVTQRRIHLGKQLQRNVVVQEGLKEGETIVVEGVQNLREGSVVNIAKPETK
jgi:membrane fusion protein (multidrug efflux system)